jgi:hypothetical protein
MCDDLKAEVASLTRKHVQCSGGQEAPRGSFSKMRLCGGGGVCLFLCVGPPAMPIHRSSVARLTLFACLEPSFVLGGIFVCRGKLVRLW